MAKKETVEQSVESVIAGLSYDDLMVALRVKQEERAKVIGSELTELQADVDSAVAACDDLLKADRSEILDRDRERRETRVTPLRTILRDRWTEAKEILPKDIYDAMRPKRSISNNSSDSRSDTYWISAKFQFVKESADLIVYHENYVSEDGTKLAMGRTTVGDFAKDAVAAVQTVIDQIEEMKVAQNGRKWAPATRDQHRAAFSKRFA